MQIDSFTITILVILLMTLIGAFTRKRQKDKCLRDFRNSPVTIERINGEIIAKGILNVETTGLELKYPKTIKGNAGSFESSYLLFKHEFPQIQAVIRYHDELSKEGKKARNRELKKTYKPSVFRKMSRKFHNILKTLKDSLSEIANTMFSQFKKTRTGSMFKTHDKYVKQINTDLLESVGSAYEPLLENYIGYKVIFEVIKESKLFKFSGILKDYTTNFIEIMDVEYKINETDEAKTADIVFPQKLAIIRHLGESQVQDDFPFLNEMKNFTEKISELSLYKKKNKKENPANTL